MLTPLSKITDHSPPPKENHAETLNPIYPRNNNSSTKKECELYESSPDHVYQYVDTKDRSNYLQPQQNQTYDYAVVDGPLTKSDHVNKELERKEEESRALRDDEEVKHDKTRQQPHKYYVLEEP